MTIRTVAAESMTDIPSMRLVKKGGGYSITVYKPKSQDKKKAVKILKDVFITGIMHGLHVTP